MHMQFRWLTAAGAVLLAAAAGLGVAAAQPTPAAATAAPVVESPGRVLFVRGDALWEVVGDGKGEREVAKLPATIGTITALEASPDGGLVVARGDAGSAWLAAGETTFRTGCAGRARPSPTSECLVCEANGQLTLLGATKDWKVTVPGTWRDIGFLGSSRELAALTDDGVLGVLVKTPTQRRQLGGKGAAGYLLVSPDGSKGVAVFGRGAASRVHGFLLDGVGTPRNLGGPGVPYAWSWDSVWVLIESGVPDDEPVPAGGEPGGEPADGEGDEGGGEADESGWLEGGRAPGVLVAASGDRAWLLAKGTSSKSGKKKKKKGTSSKKKQDEVRQERAPRTRTCVSRAIGGENKCWSGFSPRGFAPGNDKVLLWREGVLYVGKIAGVRPDPPRKLVEKADGPAVWVK